MIIISSSNALHLLLSRADHILDLPLQILIGVLLDGRILSQSPALLPPLREELAITHRTQALAARLVAYDEPTPQEEDETEEADKGDHIDEELTEIYPLRGYTDPILGVVQHQHVVLEDRLAQDHPIIVCLLDVQRQLLTVVGQEKVLHLQGYLHPTETYEDLLLQQLLTVVLITGRALHEE